MLLSITIDLSIVVIEARHPDLLQNHRPLTPWYLLCLLKRFPPNNMTGLPLRDVLKVGLSAIAK